MYFHSFNLSFVNPFFRYSLELHYHTFKLPIFGWWSTDVSLALESIRLTSADEHGYHTNPDAQIDSHRWATQSTSVSQQTN
jgi:hypothetical protein